MAFIKSHSNYVLKKKHQTISDGTIWERDITTIGGVNQFSPGQVPIYKSSNFIITVRNDGKIANQFNQTKWKENESGDTWTLETISGMTSEFEDQNDVKIVLKQDYYDFCDFAYYGSLTELFRASINDVLQRFPGELYGTDTYAYYTTGVTSDFENVEGKVPLGKPIAETSVDRRVVVNGSTSIVNRCGSDEFNIDTNDRYVDNPFSINVHSVKKPTEAKALKYFADKGYKNYQIIVGDTEPEEDKPIEKWQSRNFIKVVKYEYILDTLYGQNAFYFDYLKPQVLQQYFDRPDNEVWWLQNDNDTITEEGREDYEELVRRFSSGDIHEQFLKYNNTFRIEKVEWPEGECGQVKRTVHSKEYQTEAEAISALPQGDAHTFYEVVSGACCGDIDCYFITPCKGYKSASVTADTVTIGAWVGDNNEIVYLSDDGNMKDIHVRPIEKFIVEFYNECDNFEKIILDRKTTPRYKAVFSVIHENEHGYYRKTEDFVFPTSYGGYNIDATSFGFNDYTTRLAEIGEYYDEYFTDNLYRSMTHEAIKNFDWTYTREFIYGGEEEFVHGGEKMQKALRIFAREFDEILTYINNIKNVGRITYDERSNVPDYFLIDEVENKGWDVCLVYPYDIKEFEANDDGTYKKDAEGNKIVISDKYEDENFQLSGDSNTKFIRQFTQNTKKEVAPYRRELLDYPYGYFISCCEGEQPCQYEGSKYHFVDAEGSGTTYYDDCPNSSSELRNRIKSYSDERTYTYLDANNEFMRRMAINSTHIWRHKGTIEGIEMILGMFGLRSKKWVESFPEYRQECDDLDYDYEITEYSSFAGRIEEKWDAIHQMYRIDWINSTKAIVYDYRSTSNYTKYGAQQANYVSYQGLPVSYRYEYLSADTPYIKVSALKPCVQQDGTNSIEDAFKVAETNEPVLKRYLYPNFNKDEQLDGNPYFQMKGGWLAKTLGEGDEIKWNFQFDVDDNIAFTCYEKEGKEDGDDIIDNHPIYKETVRNIKRVDNIAELISTPVNVLTNGTIYYVSYIEKDVAVINDIVYPIKYEYSGDNANPSRYILFTKNSEYIKVGEDRFFDTDIFVYDKNGNETHYDLTNKPSGYEVKAYIKDDGSFICKADANGHYTIDNFMVLDDELPPSGRTNYFIIDNVYYSNRIAKLSDANGESNGWRALKETDPEYIRINTIKNYYEGNNPHNGNMDYDSGHEYFEYYKRLFKYAIDESLFDERCYESFFIDLDNEIYDIGFQKLIHDNELITQYTPYISGDSKIHYFGSYYKKGEKNDDGKYECTTVKFYGEDKEKKENLNNMYNYLNKDIKVEDYILSSSDSMLGKQYPYSGITEVEYKCGEDVTYTVPVDEVTNQIMNNKRFTIKFNLHDKWYTEQGQCELKYLDDIVMNYLTQMIPSTAIIDIQYCYKEND